MVIWGRDLPKISIIVPIFNVADYLPSIGKLTKQTIVISK